MIPSTSIAPLPAATNVEPTMPPMRACEDDDGSPNHHVARFQAIAPMRPPKITAGVMTSASTIPPAIVAATLSEMKAPTKFRIAAIVTATFGFSAPVAIVVAMALAVSWKPLVKSKLTAVATSRARMTSALDMATRRPARRIGVMRSCAQSSRAAARTGYELVTKLQPFCETRRLVVVVAGVARGRRTRPEDALDREHGARARGRPVASVTAVQFGGPVALFAALKATV